MRYPIIMINRKYGIEKEFYPELSFQARYPVDVCRSGSKLIRQEQNDQVSPVGK
jgi:hypothetical protein